MKICIIGSTGHTGYVLGGLQNRLDARLAGIAPGSSGESVEGLHRNAVNKLGYSVENYDSYIEMLDRVQPDIAAIACHFNDHAAVTLEALSRGIHVFVEKPIATTLEDLNKVRAAYGNSGVRLAAMFGSRYAPSFLTAKKLIQEGRIGEVRLMNSQKSYKLGTRSELYKSRITYGGTIPWVGSHAVDWMHWLSGQSFQSVYAAHSTMHNQGHGDLEMSALCHFTFSNEVFGSANVDYLRPNKAASHGDDRIRIAGTEGILEVRDNKVFLLHNDSAELIEAPLLPGQHIFADFLNEIAGGAACSISAEDSFVVTEACLLARQSADEHRVVYFPQRG